VVSVEWDGVGWNALASRGIEERFLNFADRLLGGSEGGRKSRSASLGMTNFAAIYGTLIWW
jgi:hypothetical protein